MNTLLLAGSIIIVMVLLGFLVGSHLMLLKRLSVPAPVQEVPVSAGPEPLTLDKIAEAVRFNGYVPEKNEDSVVFRVQGEAYFIDADRLPLLFLVRVFNVNPNEWDIDLLREAAHRMSDQLAMVKATFSDDGEELRFFVGAHERNYESFRDNLSTYMSLILDGQRYLNEEYARMENERSETALSTQPILPPSQSETKIMS